MIKLTKKQKANRAAHRLLDDVVMIRQVRLCSRIPLEVKEEIIDKMYAIIESDNLDIMWRVDFDLYKNVLNTAFIWAMSKEGLDYWNFIDNILNDVCIWDNEEYVRIKSNPC